MRIITTASGLGSGVFKIVMRKISWFWHGLTLRKAINLAISGAQFYLKSEKAYNMPVIVKIDISPACNLRCPSCVHGFAGEDPVLQKQDLSNKHKMDIPHFTQLIDQIKATTSAVSLYYLGDPLAHPQLEEMCRIASDAGLGVHVGTNFSFRMTDERIRRLATCGITEFTADLDGMTQETYELTRVGANLETTMHNLKRLCAVKRELKLKFPVIEVQYIIFQHNVDDLEAAEQFCEEIGVDQFSSFWGNFHNYTDLGPDRFTVNEPKKPEKNAPPLCTWPHFNTLVKSNGDVIPCCWNREGEQYTPDGDKRVVGNVFESSLKEIWKSPKYETMRAMVNNPEKAMNESSDAKESFCHGCSMLFDTTRNENRQSARDYTWDDIFTMGPNGDPIRREQTPQL
ncbi:MAG: SPASM domain-containing protein [Myxococcales bacterium]|nr:SPASM domain-containing protein [Myxococcales bacterium]